MSKNNLYISAAVAALVVLGGVALYFMQQKPQEAQRSIPEAAPQEQGFGGELYEQAQNPAAKVPETNPFEAETNPFQQAKTNPFEGYQNPF